MARKVDEAVLARISRWADISDPMACWVYRGKSFVRSGNKTCFYGRFIINGKRYRAHRWVAEQVLGLWTETNAHATSVTTRFA